MQRYLARRRRRPSRASVDWSASPAGQQLLTPDEVPPRSLVYVGPTAHEDFLVGPSDVLMTDVVTSAIETPALDFSFPSGSFPVPGETSGHSGAFDVPVHTPMAHSITTIPGPDSFSGRSR